MDTIEHDGSLWLVTAWSKSQDGAPRPARIVRPGLNAAGLLYRWVTAS